MTSSALCVELPAVRVALEVEDAVLRDELAAAYRGFVSSAADDHRCVRVRIDVVGEAPRNDAAQRPLPEVVRTADGFRVRSDEFEAQVSGDEGRISLRRERFPVDSLLKVLIADRLRAEEGLLVHAAAIASGARAAVFPGKSGAGKSTLSRACAAEGLTVLSDELCAIRWRDGRPAVFGTPWNVGVPASAQVAWVAALAHGAEHRMEHAAPSDVLKEVLANVLLADASAEGRAAVFRAASRLLAGTASRRLTFALTPGVGRVVADEIGPA